jgi:hypothetical protein
VGQVRISAVQTYLDQQSAHHGYDLRLLPPSIEECALLLMNNGQHFVGKVYPQVLIEAGINQLWQPSAYAGTCGEYTSGLIQNWLNSRE